MINWFNHLYPYSNFHELNLDWVIATVKHGEKEIADFIGINTIKYADPILWNIESQYEANTVVVDGQTGNAYISVKAVPSGVHLNRTEYWTQIYNYANVVDTLREQIAHNEGETTTATQPYNIDDLVFIDGLLYRVIAPMIAGDSFVVDSNIEKTTIEHELDRIKSDIDDETTARTEADTQLQTNIDNEATERANNDTLITNSVTTLRENYEAYKRNGVVNVKDYGAMGDGVTDDTTAIQNACDSITNGVVVFPKGTYIISDTIHLAGNLGGNYLLFGESELKWNGARDNISFMLSIDKMITGAPESQCVIEGLILNGNTTAHGGIITNCFHDIIKDSKLLDFSGVAIEIGVAGSWKSIQTYLDNLYIFQVLSPWSEAIDTVGVRFNMPDCIVNNVFVNRYTYAMEFNDGNHIINNVHLGEQRETPVSDLTGTAFKLNNPPAPCTLRINNAYIDTFKKVFDCSSYLWNVTINNSFYFFNDNEVTQDCECFVCVGSAYGIDVNNLDIIPSNKGIIRDTFNTYGKTENLYQEFNIHHNFLHPTNNELLLANNRCTSDEMHLVIESTGNTVAGRYYKVGAIVNISGTNDLVKIRMSQGWYCYEEHVVRRLLNTWNVDETFIPAVNTNFELVIADNPTVVTINEKNYDVYYVYLHFINAYNGDIRISIEPLSGNIFKAYAYTSQNRDDYTDIAPTGTTLPKA